MAGKLNLCEIELTGRDKVVCRLSSARHGKSICRKVGGQRLESGDDDVLVRRPSIRCVPKGTCQRRLLYIRLFRLPLQASNIHEGDRESTVVLVHNHVRGGEITECFCLFSGMNVPSHTPPGHMLQTADWLRTLAS